MSKKIYLINAKDEFELVEKINSFDKPTFATQPMQKSDDTWVAFVYLEEAREKKPPTDNMVRFLTNKSNLSEIEIAKINYKNASDLIGEIKAGKKNG